jgi:hypothetical protein
LAPEVLSLARRIVSSIKPKEEITARIEKLLDQRQQALEKRIDQIYNASLSRKEKLINNVFERIKGKQEKLQLRPIEQFVSRAPTPEQSLRERTFRTLEENIAWTRPGELLTFDRLFKLWRDTFNNVSYVAMFKKALPYLANEKIDTGYFIYHLLNNKQYDDATKEMVVNELQKLDNKLPAFITQSQRDALMNNAPLALKKVYEDMYAQFGSLGYIANYQGYRELANILSNGTTIQMGGGLFTKLILTMKKYALGLSIFHAVSLLKSGLFADYDQAFVIKNALGSKETYEDTYRELSKKVQQFFVDHPDIVPMTYRGRTFSSYKYENIFDKVYKSPYQTIADMARFNDKLIWEKLYPLQKLSAMAQAIDTYNKDLNAKDLMRRMDNINYVFGGSRQMNLYLTKNMQTALRFILFAPDWLYTLFRQKANAFSARDLESVSYFTRMVAYTMLLNNLIQSSGGEGQNFSLESLKEVAQATMHDPLAISHYLNQWTTTTLHMPSGRTVSIDTASYEREIDKMIYRPLRALYGGDINSFIKEFVQTTVNKTTIPTRIITSLSSDPTLGNIVRLMTPYSAPDVTQKFGGYNALTTVLSAMGFRSYEPSVPSSFRDIYSSTNPLNEKDYASIVQRYAKTHRVNGGDMSSEPIVRDMSRAIIYNNNRDSINNLTNNLINVVNKLKKNLNQPNADYNTIGDWLSGDNLIVIAENNPQVNKTLREIYQQAKTSNQYSGAIHLYYNYLLSTDPQSAQSFLNSYTNLKQPIWDTNQIPTPDEVKALDWIIAGANPVNIINEALRTAATAARSNIRKKMDKEQ